MFSMQIQYKVINIFPVVLEFSCTYWIVPPRAILMESRTLSIFSVFFAHRLVRNGQQPSFCSRDFKVCHNKFHNLINFKDNIDLLRYCNTVVILKLIIFQILISYGF